MQAKIVLCKRWTKFVLHIIFRNARFISSRHWFYGNTIVFYLVQKLKLFVERDTAEHSLPALRAICQKDNGRYIILDSYVWWWSSWCFCGMIDQWKTFSLISSQDRCQRSSPTWISNMLQAGWNLHRTCVQTLLNEVVQ